jgi:hypothetical protein
MAMRRLARAIAKILVRLSAEPNLLQVHFLDDERGVFQLAQQRFDPPNDSPGVKLAWLSEMRGRTTIVDPRVEVYRYGDRGFIHTAHKGNFGPTHLVPVKGPKA